MTARGHARIARSVIFAMLATACSDDGDTPPADTDTDSQTDTTAASPSSGATADSDDAGTTTAPADDSGSSTTGIVDDTGEGTTGDRPSVVVDAPIRIAYLADDVVRGTDELWLRDEADYDAGPLRLSHMLPEGAFISPFFPVSSDGRWLVYRMIQPGPGTEHELWAAAVAMSAPEAPFRVDDTAELVHEYAITPDASAVAWINASGIHTSSLLAASPGPVVTHTPAPTGEGEYGLFELHAGSDTIAYTADPDGSGVDNAFVISLVSGTALQLSDLTAPGTAVDGNSLAFAADALVYQADRDVAEPELFWAPLAGGPPVKINDPVIDESVRTERVAPGGGAIAWWMGELGGPDTPDVGTVFVAGLPDTGPTAPIDVHAGQGGFPQQGRIVWAPDASAMLYSVFFVDRLEGWLVEVDAGVPDIPQRITGDVLTDGEFLVSHVFDAAGNVFYVAGTGESDELFFVDRSGGAPAAPVRISPTPVGTGLSGDVRFSPDGTTAVFTGFVDSSVVRDLYRVDLSAAAPWPVARVDTGLRDGDGVTPGPLFSADGQHVVYTATDFEQTERHLFDVPPGGTGFESVLPISAGGYVTAYTILP